jgi:DNA invertase Pin-like site-specific DNA recombinase
MPRNQGSGNLSNYHYLVKKYSDNDKTVLETKKYYKTQSEIANEYGLNRSSIYFVINPNNKRLSRKWQNLTIEKLSPPIPIYEQVEKSYED